ncbi:MAG: response regulator [Chloroflexi bacterium]|nr:response regulator [Chloroflexota bacterium]
MATDGTPSGQEAHSCAKGKRGGCIVMPLGTPSLGNLSVDERIRFLLDWLMSVAGAEAGVILLDDGEGQFAARTWAGLPDATGAVRIQPDDVFAGIIEHEPALVRTEGRATPCGRWVADPSARMTVSLPLDIQGRLHGVAQLSFRSPRTLEPDVVRRLSIIADHIAAVVEASRLHREQDRRSAELAQISAGLLDVDRMKGDFLSMISHELRTPLTAIIGYTDLLLRQVHGTLSDRQQQHQQAVKKAANRLLSLINDLLDLNRLESGSITLTLVPVPLSEAIARAIGDVEATARQQDIDVRLDVPSVSPVVEADADRLNQILVNLLDNALKFTPRGGTVVLRVERGERLARVTVQDSGVGISPEQIDRIWDRFHQGDSSTRRHFGGTGLGLAIVRHLVTLHGGSVEAYSAGPGQGSHFDVTLPLSEERVTPAHLEPASPASAALDTSRRRILIVDDEPDNREVIASIVEDILGYQAITAATGARGLERARERPDLILLDLRLPDLSGFEVARRLSSDPATRGIPILAITALDQEDDRHAAERAGCVGFVGKPFTQQGLAEAIARALDLVGTGTRSSGGAWFSPGGA